MEINEAVVTFEYEVSVHNVTEDAVSNYFAVVIRLGRLGGATIEEDRMIDAMVAHLGVRSSVIVRANELAKDESITTADLVKNLKSARGRVCAYRDAYRVALADGEFSAEEEGFLAEIAGHMGFSPDIAQEIRDIVDNGRRDRMRFRELIEMVP